MEVAAATGIPKATAYRLARTMEAADYLVLDPLTGRYHLGPAAVALTYLSRSYSELARTARPYLEALASETGETVNLAVEIDGKAVLVDEKRTSRPFKSEVPVGRIIGDIANSNGKIFAAFKPEGDRQSIASSPHQPLTPHTIVGREALLAEFERVRREGIAYDIEERSLGVCAVGAPVSDQAGTVVAAVSTRRSQRAVRARGERQLFRSCPQDGGFTLGVSRLFAAGGLTQHGGQLAAANRSRPRFRLARRRSRFRHLTRLTQHPGIALDMQGFLPLIPWTTSNSNQDEAAAAESALDGAMRRPRSHT